MRGTTVCIKCNTSESKQWTNADQLGAVCFDCLKDLGGKPSDEDNAAAEEPKEETRIMRRTRSMRTAAASTSSGGSSGNLTAAPSSGNNVSPCGTLATSKETKPTKVGGKQTVAKGRGRRMIFKKVPTKAPTAVATPVTSDFIYYKGLYYQKGDIVSLIDEDDHTYYAQLRGFLTDQYCEKSAVITWLLPTQESPPPADGFDPATYIVGPEEEMPRNMDCMEFVMHAPSDYYKSKVTPYPPVHPSPEPGYIWTRLEPISRFLPRSAPNN